MPNPVPSELALPLWGQIGAVLAFIAGAFGVVRNAWKSEAKPDRQNDTVVVSGSFADGTAIAKLTRSIDALAEAWERGDHTQAQRWSDLLDGVAALKREERTTNEEVRSIGELLAKHQKENQHDLHGLRAGMEAFVRLFRPKPFSEILRDEREPVPTPLDDPVIPDSLREAS